LIKVALLKKLIWFSLLVYLLTGFGSAFGAVWCLHEEGDCLPLAAALSCCPADEAPASLLVETAVLQASDCGPCIDIALTSPVLKSRIRTAPSLGTPLVASVPPLFSSPFPPTDRQLQHPSDSFLPGASLALIHLRTVVLLN